MSQLMCRTIVKVDVESYLGSLEVNMADIHDSKLKRYFSDYAHPEKTKREVIALMKSYKGLQLEQDTYGKL
ncbi:hypothetical protein M8J76_011778 [Diaphorina citri]|nr:hypothetical protein M8J76_011778 [Diaphorina citri]